MTVATARTIEIENNFVYLCSHSLISIYYELLTENSIQLCVCVRGAIFFPLSRYFYLGYCCFVGFCFDLCLAFCSY